MSTSAAGRTRGHTGVIEEEVDVHRSPEEVFDYMQPQLKRDIATIKAKLEGDS